jgi:hypothetical protein
VIQTDCSLQQEAVKEVCEVLTELKMNASHAGRAERMLVASESLLMTVNHTIESSAVLPRDRTVRSLSALGARLNVFPLQ